jgi:hypothetical protein
LLLRILGRSRLLGSWDILAALLIPSSLLRVVPWREVFRIVLLDERLDPVEGRLHGAALRRLAVPHLFCNVAGEVLVHVLLEGETFALDDLEVRQKS